MDTDIDLTRWHRDPDEARRLITLGFPPLPLMFTHPERAAKLAREAGIAHGYPRCCVEEFAQDIAAGRLPAQLRGSVPAGYVPCADCRVAAEEAIS